MRAHRLLLLTACLPTLAAQGTDPGQGILTEFSYFHSNCGYSHDPVVEKALHAAIRIEPPRAPKKTSVAILEMRNDSSKTVTAYLLTSARTRGAKTDRYDAEGVDFVQDMALRMRYTPKSDLSSLAILPSGTFRKELWSGRFPGRFEVYPCLVVFEDGTYLGPRELMRRVVGDRQSRARTLGRLIAELEAARGAGDPKATLTRRAEHFARLEESGPQMEEVTEGTGVRIISSVDPIAPDLKEAASHLSGAAAADRAALANDISTFRTQQEFLVARSKLVPPERAVK